MTYSVRGLIVLATVLLLAIAGLASPRTEQARPAVRLDAVTGILDAYRSHSVVAFPDPFDPVIPTLLTHPDFTALVDDLVVEFGNARYQDVMDRFQRGDSVPDAVLRRIWLDSTDTQALWMSARYEAFVHMVREVNAQRPANRQLRVLLGDPPIDWDDVHSRAQYDAWARQHDSHPADLVRREVIAKNRRALLLYSPMHYQRRNSRAGYVSDGPNATLVSRLEQGGVKVFTIWPTDRYLLIDRSMFDLNVHWNGGLAILRGTVLGAADFEMYVAPDRDLFVQTSHGIDTRIPAHGPDWRAVRMEDRFDAVLIRDPDAAVPPPSPDVFCADSRLISTALSRMTTAGVPRTEVERLDDFCSPLQRSFLAMNPDARRIVVVDSVTLASGARLQVVVAQPMPPYGDPYNAPANYADWFADQVLAVVLRGPAPGTAQLLYSAQHQEDDCCGVSVWRMTSSEIVITRSGEKFRTMPTLKFFFDESTATLIRREFEPFQARGVTQEPSSLEFRFHDGKQMVAARPTSAPPFIAVSGPPVPITDQNQPVRDDRSRPTVIPGFTLPQTVPVAIGQPPEEWIGPVARDGSRIWFGKRFDGAGGTGGFGYFDTATSKYEIFSPPEMSDTPVQSILVEPATIWLGLAEYGDMGEYGRGLLRIQRAGMKADVIPVGGLVRSIVRFGDRLYLPTEDSVEILFPDNHLESWFIDVDREGRPKMSRAIPGGK